MAQHNHRIRHDELLTAIISASVVNTSMCAPKDPLPFTTFMPSEWESTKPRLKRITKAEREFRHSSIRSFMLARETHEGTTRQQEAQS